MSLSSPPRPEITSSPPPALIVSALSVPTSVSPAGPPLIVLATTTAPVARAIATSTATASSRAWLRSPMRRAPAPVFGVVPLKRGRDYPTVAGDAPLRREDGSAQAGAGGRLDQPALVQQLRHLDGVGRRAFAEVVADHPEVEAALVRGVPADAADQDLIAARRRDRQRVDPGARVIEDDQAVGGGEQLAAFLGREVVLRLQVDGLGVAGHHRDPRAGRRDPHVFAEPEDLARLAHHLALLGRVVIAVLERLDLGQDVEGDLMGIDAWLRRLTVENRPRLLPQLPDCVSAGARDRLIGGDDQPLDPDRVEDRLQRHHQLHRGAVGIRDQAVVIGDRVVVHPRHDEGYVVMHPPVARVVDDHGTRIDDLRRPLRAHLAPGGGKHQVEALDRSVGQLLDLELGAGERNAAARRASGGERHQLGDREPALGQHLEDRRADGAGGAEDADAIAGVVAHELTVGRCSAPVGSSLRIASSPSSNAVWSASTACGTWSARITQEILIGEVEIISMLILFSPSTRKTLAATPGWLRIPAPTIETLPIDWSVSMPISESSSRIASTAASRSSASTVNDRSAPPSWDTGSFWMIMSTLMLASASAPKMRPATPGSSGTPVRVTRASSVEWVTAVTSGRSMVSCSETTRVPGASSAELRQWMRTP